MPSPCDGDAIPARDTLPGMDKIAIINAVRERGDLDALGREPYEPRGILNSELPLIVAACRTAKIDVLVESGRARGQSTDVLSRYLAGAGGLELYSLERKRDADAEYCEKRLAGRKGLHLLYGDANFELPKLVRSLRGKRIAVLIDGPKGRAAVELMAECVAASNDVVLGFIHDMYRRRYGKPAPGRTACEALFPSAFYTEDEDYVALTRGADDAIWAMPSAGLSEPGKLKGGEIGSYGPTLAAIFVDDADRARARKRLRHVPILVRVNWAAARLLPTVRA